jgi:predicted dehydrogenase
MDRSIGIAVIGLGRIGLRHADSIAHRGRSCRLVRVVDAREAVARTAGERYRVTWDTSHESALSDPSVDAVVIATPTPLHRTMIEAAARARKAVFCEKPVAFDVESARRAADAAAASGIFLQVGFHRRCDPDWRAAADRIAAGELGDPYLFRASFRDKAPPPLDFLRSSGGLFVDLMIHDFDAARWLVGEVEEVNAYAAALSGNALDAIGDYDNAVVQLRFANGALGVIDNSRVAGYGCECSAEIMGSGGTVRIARHWRNATTWLSNGLASVDWLDDLTELQQAAYDNELEEFALAVHGAARLGATGADAVGALEIAKACEESQRIGRPVKVIHANATDPAGAHV